MTEAPNLTALWFQIEELLNRVAADDERSPLQAQVEIAERLNELLREAESSLAAAGILGAAFLFGDSSGEGWSLFERLGKRGRGATPLSAAFESVTSVSTPYIINASAEYRGQTAALKQLVHLLFVEVREIQERASEASKSEPEFFAWLPRPGTTTPFTWEQSLRDLLSVHYVGEGELTVALLTWRTLQALAKLESSQGPCTLDERTPCAGVPEAWLGFPLTALKEVAPQVQIARVLVGKRTWLEECRTLIGAGDMRGRTAEFARRLEVSLDRRSGSASAARALEQLARTYAALVSDEPAGSAASELLLAYERSARAPLPPYFFWHLAERQGRAHLVAPVWTSAMNPLQLKEQDGSAASIQPSVGLALAAVAPIPEFERILEGKNTQAETELYGALAILTLLRQISRPLVEFVFYEPARRRERSAQANQLVAAIMSRNLSHNIGSHVLYHLREQMERQTPEDARVADLLKYLQARMDFIALLSSEGSTWPGVVSLEHLREPYADEDGLLLKHIVKSQRSVPPRVVMTTQHAGNRLSGKEEDIHFAIPTGAVGAQAVYSILENFIRNSAKYGTASPDTPLEVRIEIEPDPDWPDYWRCILRDNNRSVMASAERVVESFSQPLFDHNDPAQSHRNWGLKEMKIAALFLAGGAEALRSQYNSGRSPYSGPLPSWILAERADGQCNLQLRFHLMRPLGICLVGQKVSKYFPPGQLMHIFNDAAGLLAQSSARGRRYEMLVVDREVIAEIGSTQATQSFLQNAMRVAYVGEPPADGALLENPDFLSIASSWAELGERASAKGEQPWHAIGDAWVECRWPNRSTVFASSSASTESEFKALVERVVPEFTKKRPQGDVSRWLVWDHSVHDEHEDRIARRAGDTPIYERFEFHRPVSHPFVVGLGPSDGRWRLKEAACIQIAIIDERVWGSRTRVAKDQGYKKVPLRARGLRSAWGRAGVHLIDAAAIDLWPEHELDEPHAVLQKLPAEADVEKFDFLVVHRSLIDQRASIEVERGSRPHNPDLGLDRRDENVQRIVTWLRACSHKIVVTSGRGLEPAYHKVLEMTGAGFVEFSALADALIDSVGDKVGLVKLLRSV